MALYECTKCGKKVNKPPSQWHPNYKCKSCYINSPDFKNDGHSMDCMDKLLNFAEILKKYPNSKLFFKGKNDR